MFVLVYYRVQLALWVALMVVPGPMEVLLMALLVHKDLLLPWAHITLGPMARALLDHSKNFLLHGVKHVLFFSLFLKGVNSISDELSESYFYPQWSPSSIPASRLGQRIPPLAARAARSQ